MGGFGTGSWGTSPWGIGAPPAPFSVVSAVPTDSNTIRVTFSSEPKRIHDRFADDALNPANYVLTVVLGPSTTWTPRIISVENRDGASSTTVYLRTNMRLPGILMGRHTTFRCQISRVISAAGAPLTGMPTADFRSLNQVMQETTVRFKASTGKDIANPQTPNSPTGGAFVVDEKGNYKRVEGSEYVLKRLWRRVTTRKGSFFHLPDYGVSITVKDLALSTNAINLKHEMKRELLKDPDVKEAQVEVTIRPGLVIYYVAAKTRQGLDLKFEVPYVLRAG